MCRRNVQPTRQTSTILSLHTRPPQNLKTTLHPETADEPDAIPRSRPRHTKQTAACSASWGKRAQARQAETEAEKPLTGSAPNRTPLHVKEKKIAGTFHEDQKTQKPQSMWRPGPNQEKKRLRKRHNNPSQRRAGSKAKTGFGATMTGAPEESVAESQRTDGVNLVGGAPHPPKRRAMTIGMQTRMHALDVTATKH